MRPVKFSNSVGTCPLSGLRESHSSSRSGRRPSPAGTGPVSRLAWRFRTSRRVRLLNSAGMGPTKPAFPPISSHRSWESVPSSGGSDPVNPWSTKSCAESSRPPRCSRVTRPSSFASTPNVRQPVRVVGPVVDVYVSCSARIGGSAGVAGRRRRTGGGGPPGTRDVSSSASTAAGCRTHGGMRTGQLRPRCCAGYPKGPEKRAAYTTAPASSMSSDDRGCHTRFHLAGWGGTAPALTLL